MLDTPEFRFALDAVRRATHVAQRVQHEMISPALTKDDRSPVTVGDFAAQAVVARLLRQTFPDMPLVGEESAQVLRQPDQSAVLEQVAGFVRREFSEATPQAVLDWIDVGASDAAERFWTVDPIDGTKGFLRGEQYSVCLALIENGIVQLGAIGCPNLNTHGEPEKGRGSIYVAARGQGAWVVAFDGESEYRRLNVSNVVDVQQTRLLRSVETGHTDAGKIDELVAALEIVADPVPMDSQAKYAVLACGGGDAITRLISPSRPNYKEKIWDQAAGSILVEEAGGRVTDLDGQPLDFGQGRTLAQNRGVLVSNGPLHDALLAALKRIGA